MTHSACIRLLERNEIQDSLPKPSVTAHGAEELNAVAVPAWVGRAVGIAAGLSVRASSMQH